MVQKLSQQYIDLVKKGKYVPCIVIHDHSCTWYSVLKFCSVFKIAIKFYIPMNIIPVILFEQKKLKREPKKVIKKVVLGGLRSAIFVSIYVASFWWYVCLFKNIRLKTDKTNIMLASFFCSFAVLLESSKRRTELALYLFPRLLELIKIIINEKTGMFKTNQGFDNFVMALAMGIILYFY